MSGSSAVRTIARVVLAAFMLFAGVSHFRSQQSFLAQVPPFLPAREFIVQASGVIEIAVALTLLLARKHRASVGWALAGFFVLVFPGNISQYLTHTSAFGLDTDTSRGIRLLFQPVLIAWALWCTGAWAQRGTVRAGLRERFLRR